MTERPVTDADVAKAVQETVDEVNRIAPPPKKLIKSPGNEPPEFRFVELADNLAEVVLENARGQVTKAQNNLHQAEAMVEDIRSKSKNLWEMLQDFERQLEDYSGSALEAHNRFIGTAKKGNSK